MSAGKNTDSWAGPLVDMFSKPAELDPELETELVSERDTVDDRRPRGLTEQGLVRTTGWLRVGTHPVSSGVVTAVVCLLLAFLAAIILLPFYPVVSGLCLLLLPAAGYGFWRLVTTRIAPASTTHNIDTVPAGQLQLGSWIRLYGTIGPVGQVADVEPDQQSTEDQVELVHVTLTGGHRMTWPRDHRLHLAELRD